MKKKNTHKYTSIFILLIISMTALFTYKEYNSYSISKDIHNDMVNTLDNEIDKYTETIFEEEERYSTYIMEELSECIQEKLKASYTDEKEFINDIENPNPETKLTKILDTCTMELVDDNNDILITSHDNVLFTNKILVKKNDIVSLNDIANGLTNTKLANQAINNIIGQNNNKKRYVFWQNTLREDNYNTYNDVTSMSVAELSKFIRDKNMNELKKYELLVPVYITKDGDILGNTDISSIGGYNKTYKIIIIHRINVYDILNKYHANYINLSNKIDYIKDSAEREFKYTITTLSLSFIFIIILVFGSSYIQNKILKNNE